MNRLDMEAQYLEDQTKAIESNVYQEWMREMALKDLYFLITNVFGREDVRRDWLYERCREVNSNPDGHLDLWFREGYKDLANNTPMLTANRGWTTHGELVVGDVVFSPSGTPVNVVAVTETFMDSSCYKIIFEEGSSIIAGSKHEWTIRNRRKLRQKDTTKRKNEFTDKTMTTLELYNIINSNMSSFKKRLDVGCAEPLFYGEKNLPIPPYSFGCWLGDGCSRDPKITCSYEDLQIIDEMRKELNEVKEVSSTNENSGLFAFGNGTRGKKGTGLWPIFRSLGVAGNKHIPDVYMEASVEQRLALLQGLMDTDGACDSRGHATFCQKDEKLSKQVYDLAAGLALKPRIRRYSSFYNGVPYDYFQVNFMAHQDRIPFRLKRKADRAIPVSYYRGIRTIKSVEAIESVPTKCIQVEGGRYLAGKELIPTNNSSIITYALTIQDILNDPNITVGIFSYNRPTAKTFLWQIKREFETNELLKLLFPDILWTNPQGEAPRWSMDEGIIVRRTSNPKEATVEAWGLVDGQPTGRHFRLLVYDDVVTLDSVTSPEMCAKTTRAWEMSRNLGAEGGRTRYIGTRYSYNDTYGEMLRRGVVIPRIYPVLDANNEPVLLSRERIEEKRKEFGPYVFSCHGAGTKVLMADWSLKNIEDINQGEMVVGWSMEAGKRSKLVPTKVLCTSVRDRDTIKATMECGMEIICTPDHKWWTGRRTTDNGRSIYSPINIENPTRGVSSLCKVVEVQLQQNLTEQEKEAAYYLAGIFDGEGSVTSRCIQITQSETIHPEVCRRIEKCLEILRFQYNAYRPETREGIVHYCINGGRSENFRFLNLTNPAKRKQIADSLFGARYFVGKTTGIDTREKVISVIPNGIKPVYNLETETGNYIANGYCSKNSQMLQNPVADEAQNFKEEWLQTWTAQNLSNLKIYILVDPASKKKKNSDYTAIFVIGLGTDRNYYVIDMLRDRLNLTERTSTLFWLHKAYHPVAVGYEEYGMQSDIEHLQYVMEQENYRFPIYPLGGNVGKEDRIRALVPVFEQKRIFLPQVCIRTRSDKKTVDLTKVFIEEEYKTFPVGAHDDMLDALARILDHGKKGIFATFPTELTPEEKRTMPSLNKIVQLEREEIWEGVKRAEEMENALYDSF